MVTEEEMMDLMQSAEGLVKLASEPLHPDLEPWVEDNPMLGKCLKHPLVYDITMSLPGHANLRYEAKKEALQDALDRKDWDRVVFLHERPYRCWALIEYVVGLDDLTADPIPLVLCSEEVRDLAGTVWVNSENIDQHTDDWGHLFGDWEAGDPMLFNDDPEGWDSLSDPLTVYRAGIDDGGWSWTLDPKIAKFFATRFGENHVVTTGKVNKDHVFGYFTQRSESEVLVLDGAVFDTRPFDPTSV